MNPGVVLGVDPGSERVGLAVSDSEQRFALPLEVVPAGDEALARIVRLAEERGASEIVVGLPLGLGGSEGAAAAKAKMLAMELERSLGLPVRLYDERLTTAQAERELKNAGIPSRARRRTVDRSAAAIMMKEYLDSSARR